MSSPDPFAPPPIRVDAQTLRDYFKEVGRESETILRNYHHENPVSPERHGEARRAAVLIGLTDDTTPRLLLTRRPKSISAPGQLCFPGGTHDRGDRGPIETALRETREETGIATDAVEPLGVLGRYYSHSGHEITPVVALLRTPYELAPNPAEVDEVLHLPADLAFHPDSYRLVRYAPEHPRAHYFLSTGSSSVTGPTVCLVMHLYERLAAFLER